ncbi:hypothetical protein B0T25DRAFT_7595 [Lasiosphaeria hispida]|uniref:Uncharacterized protein n=1 Tax=Lasiosphaeria hispida TaxID=260671 RepID=A0AAJ0HTE0_9PEZI|nr:hypothetical protein B0T25DRAFT_7595 [Lasiosphaeria hispida]
MTQNNVHAKSYLKMWRGAITVELLVVLCVVVGGEISVTISTTVGTHDIAANSWHGSPPAIDPWLLGMPYHHHGNPCTV